jgi:hypothetical protein
MVGGMPIHVFPVHLFNPREVRARIIESVISGGVSLSGEEDVIATDGGGRWEITFDGITLRTPAQIKAWEAWEGHLGRGATDVLVPLLSIGHANRSSHGLGAMAVSKLVVDDPVFPTSAVYSSPHITAAISANAALRATQIGITVTKGAPLVGGEKFSISERAYRIVRPLGSGQFQIEPPLREAATAGDACTFDWPLLKCRSAPGESWSPALSFGRRGEASIRFMENAV